MNKKYYCEDRLHTLHLSLFIFNIFGKIFIMKERILSLAVLLMVSVASFAQAQVTRFMGIPVDGFKKDMIQKLEAKGFEFDKTNDCLTGEFNGTDVLLYVVTNNNKVCRIMLCDKNVMDEGDIKIRFNNLCHQFGNNERYISLADEDQTIPEETDISYEMDVHNKKFDALFYQKVDYSLVDTLAVKELIKNNVEELIKNDKELSTDSLGNKISEETLGKVKDVMSETAFKIALSKMQFEMPVWFRICEYGGKYYITMYYDNEYNRANGEDL